MVMEQPELLVGVWGASPQQPLVQILQPNLSPNLEKYVLWVDFRLPMGQLALDQGILRSLEITR